MLIGRQLQWNDFTNFDVHSSSFKQEITRSENGKQKLRMIRGLKTNSQPRSQEIRFSVKERRSPGNEADEFFEFVKNNIALFLDKNFTKAHG